MKLSKDKSVIRFGRGITLYAEPKLCMAGVQELKKGASAIHNNGHSSRSRWVMGIENEDHKMVYTNIPYTKLKPIQKKLSRLVDAYEMGVEKEPEEIGGLTMRAFYDDVLYRTDIKYDGKGIISIEIENFIAPIKREKSGAMHISLNEKKFSKTGVFTVPVEEFESIWDEMVEYTKNYTLLHHQEVNALAEELSMGDEEVAM